MNALKIPVTQGQKEVKFTIASMYHKVDNVLTWPMKTLTLTMKPEVSFLSSQMVRTKFFVQSAPVDPAPPPLNSVFKPCLQVTSAFASNVKNGFYGNK